LTSLTVEYFLAYFNMYEPFKIEATFLVMIVW